MIVTVIVILVCKPSVRRSTQAAEPVLGTIVPALHLPRGYNRCFLLPKQRCLLGDAEKLLYPMLSGDETRLGISCLLCANSHRQV